MKYSFDDDWFNAHPHLPNLVDEITRIHHMLKWNSILCLFNGEARLGLAREAHLLKVVFNRMVVSFPSPLSPVDRFDSTSDRVECANYVIGYLVMLLAIW